jgi:hypothetical protein
MGATAKLFVDSYENSINGESNLHKYEAVCQRCPPFLQTSHLSSVLRAVVTIRLSVGATVLAPSQKMSRLNATLKLVFCWGEFFFVLVSLAIVIASGLVSLGKVAALVCKRSSRTSCHCYTTLT